MSLEEHAKKFAEQYPGSDRFIYYATKDIFLSKSTKPNASHRNRNEVEEFLRKSEEINNAWISWKKAITLPPTFMESVKSNCGLDDEQLIYLQVLLEENGIRVE